MNIFEKSTKENKSIINSITEILNDRFNINVTVEDVKDVVRSMSLSDFIEIDSAIDNEDIELLKSIFTNDTEITEYSIQGRQGLKSIANNRPTPTKTTTSTTTKPQNQEITINTNSDDDNQTSGSTTGSLSPTEYSNKNKEEVEEIEKIKKMAGIK